MLVFTEKERQEGSKPKWKTENKATPLGEDGLDYVEARKKAYYSTKKYVEGKGFKLDKHLFEDCFQEALLHLWENQKEIMEKSIKKGFPIDSFITRKTRQKYIDYVRKFSQREDNIPSFLPEDMEGDRKNLSVTYQLNNYPSPEQQYIQKEEDKEFFSKLTPRQYKISKSIVAGYNQKEITKMLQVNRSTIYRELQGLKYELSSK